jgi:hypothetical protein
MLIVLCPHAREVQRVYLAFGYMHTHGYQEAPKTFLLDAHMETAPASFKDFACRTREDVRKYNYVASGCSSATSAMPCAATTCHSATGSTSTSPCAVTTRLQPHALYVNLAVRRDYLSPGRTCSTSTSSCTASTTPPPPRVRVPRHVARLVTRLVAPLVVDNSASRRLVVDYFAYAARLGASARRAAHRSSSTTWPTLRVWVPQHVARLIACRRLLRLRRASGCLGTSRGPSHGSSSTTPCAATSSCGHAGSTSATLWGATTFLAATLALLRVRCAPPRRRLPVASR